jgi:hypothetical protein
MGAWGVGTFENDTACDFAADVIESSSLNKISAALERVLSSRTGDLQAPDAEEALAAADIIARLRGNFGPQSAYTNDVDRWAKSVKLSVSESLLDQARRSLLRILTPPSELLELWTESDQLKAWQSSVEELQHRLN